MVERQFQPVAVQEASILFAIYVLRQPFQVFFQVSLPRLIFLQRQMLIIVLKQQALSSIMSWERLLRLFLLKTKRFAKTQALH